MSFDFSGLTTAQQELLTFKGWQPGSRCNSQRWSR